VKALTTIREYPRLLSLQGVEECSLLERLNRFTVRVEVGGRAILVFIAALPHVSGFKLNHGADSALCGLITRAHRAGLEVRVLQMAYEPAGSSTILLSPDLPIEI
jgi:sugar fermentation stimulation protein A